MSDGTLSVRRRQPKASEGADQPFTAALKSGAFETFLGGTLPAIGQGRTKSKTKPKPTGDVDELRIESRRAKRLKEYDRLLKGFKYSAALDSVLKKVIHFVRLGDQMVDSSHRMSHRQQLSLLSKN